MTDLESLLKERKQFHAERAAEEQLRRAISEIQWCVTRKQLQRALTHGITHIAILRERTGGMPNTPITTKLMEQLKEAITAKRVAIRILEYPNDKAQGTVSGRI